MNIALAVGICLAVITVIYSFLNHSSTPARRYKSGETALSVVDDCYVEVIGGPFGYGEDYYKVLVPVKKDGKVVDYRIMFRFAQELEYVGDLPWRPALPAPAASNE